MITTPHVEPHINKIHIHVHIKLPFLAKTHKFLSRINSQLYGTLFCNSYQREDFPIDLIKFMTGHLEI